MENSGVQGLLQQSSLESLIQPEGLGLNASQNLAQGAYSLAKTADLLPVTGLVGEGLMLKSYDDSLISGSSLKLTTTSTPIETVKTHQADALAGTGSQVVGDLGSDTLLNQQAKGTTSQLSQIASDLKQLDGLFNTAQTLKQVKALGSLQQFSPTDLKDPVNFGLGDINNQKPGLGQVAGKPEGTAYGTEGTSFRDPLEGHRNNRPRSTVVGAGAFPSAGSLVGQDRGEPVRSWESTSEDGMITRSHETYADGSRRAERVERLEDGSSRTTSMTWGSDGRLESFSIGVYEHKTGTVYSETTRFNTDGTKSVNGMEISGEGEVRTWSTEDTVKPEDVVKTSENPDSSTGGSYINPITGQYWGPQIVSSGALVNPNENAETVVAPQLNFDPHNLVVNPSLEITAGDSQFDPNRFQPRVLINPGRP